MAVVYVLEYAEAFNVEVYCIVGFFAKRPYSMVPENTMKLGVGLLFSTFGIFWTVEGMEIFGPDITTVYADCLSAYRRPRPAADAQPDGRFGQRGKASSRRCRPPSNRCSNQARAPATKTSLARR